MVRKIMASGHTFDKKSLKGHCHGDLAEFWSKLLKYLTKNLFYNMKLLSQHREENIKVFPVARTYHNQLLATSLKYKGSTWKNWPIFSSFNLLAA